MVSSIPRYGTFQSSLRQTLLFSATWPEEVQELAGPGLPGPSPTDPKTPPWGHQNPRILGPMGLGPLVLAYVGQGQ